MTLETVFVGLFIAGVFVGLFFAACNLIGAAIYELLAIRRSSKLRAGGGAANGSYYPLVSIIIPAHNEAMVIARCLDSVLRSVYGHFEVIVVDDRSTDGTARIVRQYVRTHTNAAIRLVCKRRNGGRGTALDAGLRYSRGALVMTLDADCVLERQALGSMVGYFADRHVAAVAANIRIMHTGTLISLLQQFDYLVSFRSKKFNTLAGSEYIIGGAGATYRRAVLRALKGFDSAMKTEDIEMSLRIVRLLHKRRQRLAYASDVVIYTEPVPTYKSLLQQRFRWKFGSLQALYKHRRLLFSLQSRHSKFLTLLRLPFVLWSELLLLLEPVYFSYFLYQAIEHRNVTLFAGANIVMTLIIWLVVWADEHLKLRERLRLTAYAPMMYLVFFALTAIQILAAAKSLLHIRGITGQKRIVGAYTSPERIGHQFDPLQRG